LEFDKTEKTFDFSNVICSYGAKDSEGALSETNPGIYIGPADAFFTNGTNAISIDYVEDELIKLSFVFTGGTGTTGGDKLLEIYLNGILTGIARSSLSVPWTIQASQIDFNSSNCDIDLYKIRAYDKSLVAADIVQNYAYDLKNTTLWD
jgi:hypothetical protein